MASSSLDGRVALVTGGSGGIGSAISRRLGAAGAAVAVHYSSGRDRAEEVVDAIGAAGGRAVALEADLRHVTATEGLVAEVEVALGPVDVLVANAGLSRRASLEEVDAEAFDETLAVNLRAPFLLARRTVPGMQERGFGRVLFMSSVAGLTGGIVGPHYAASKAGLHGLTHFVARRVAASGVTVNALAPALIEETMMLPGAPDELRRLVPVGRLGRPGEVADLALAVLTNAYLTSKVIGIDGGMHPH
jgi:3-oxoacyl-[acyl-carrier protein] reductase